MNLRTIKALIMLGYKRVIEYKNRLLFGGLSIFVSVVLLSWVWSSYVPSKDFFTYFLTLNFLVINGANVVHDVSDKYGEFVEEGWHPMLSHGVSVFLYFLIVQLTISILELLPFSILVIIYFLLAHKTVFYVVFFLVVFNCATILFNSAATYFITSFTYFVQSVWGLSVIYFILSAAFGGLLVPFSILPPQYLNVLNLLPFTAMYQGAFLIISTHKFPVSLFVVLMVWSLIVGAIGHLIHRYGQRRYFESQGG